MQIICISRGTFAGGTELAKKLAEKLGSNCLSREELTDSASRAGIAVGKLEMNIVRRRPLSESLAIEKERFKAFVTATLCESALKKSLVYHGRTGHLVLPGITHVLRARAIMDPEQRITTTMKRLNLSWEKSKRYIEEVDEDRRRWVRSLYNIDWQDPSQYDVLMNLSRMTVDNAAAAMVSIAQLPEFQITPVNQRAINNLLVAAKCRLALGADPRTQEIPVKLSMDRGTITATYFPRFERKAKFIPDVLKQVDGVEEILCTMATTNLLWINEQFNPHHPSLEHILAVASKWNAAVELIQLKESGQQTDFEKENQAKESLLRDTPSDHGGILDDSPDEDEGLDEGIVQTRERLISAGRAGGYKSVSGGPKELLKNLDRTSPYSLVVVGELFSTKPASVRKRLSRELASHISENIRIPVIGDEDLKTQYLFGPKQWLTLLLFGALSALIVVLVFFNQEAILSFVEKGSCMLTDCEQVGTGDRIMSAIALFVFVPVFAYFYGGFTRILFRLIRFE